MLKRFLSLKDSQIWLSMLFIFSFMMFNSETINGFIENSFGLLCCIFLSIILNSEIFDNWKYIKSGINTDKPDRLLNSSEILLKKARSKNDSYNPLFVSSNDKSYYCEDNYKVGF